MAQGTPIKITVQNSKSSPKNAQAVSISVETEIKDGKVVPKEDKFEPGVNIGK